jgi:uncharacterized membrane protein YciS (DUF1049 family)
MRVIKALAALCFIVIGVLFGALNRDHVHVDVGVASFDVRLGFLILVVALIAACLGGLAVMAGVVWPMRRKLRVGSTHGSGPVTAEMPAMPPLREPPR